MDVDDAMRDGFEAVLCVMRTTVRPCMVDASCSKCKIALPVL